MEAVVILALCLLAIPLALLIYLNKSIRRALAKPSKGKVGHRLAIIVGSAAIWLNYGAMLAAGIFTVMVGGMKAGSASGIFLLFAPGVLGVAVVWSVVAYAICTLQVAPGKPGNPSIEA